MEDNQEPFCISYSENLPFQEYFNSIDAHFKARQNLTQGQQVWAARPPAGTPSQGKGKGSGEGKTGQGGRAGLL